MRKVGILLLTWALLLGGAGQSMAALIDGANDVEPGSEYLFGFSGGTSQTLQLTASGSGTVNLSTATSPISGSFNQGWWSPQASNFTSNTNYIVGELSGTSFYNNFFTFDISGLTGQTVSYAELQVRRESGFSSSGNTTHNYSLYDVSTDPVTLNTNNGTSATIHADLGSGTSYGTFSVTVAGSTSQILSFILNGDALADLNAAIANGDDYFSIGGTLFAEAVPEPGTLALAGMGLIGLAGYVRRRRARKLAV